MQNHDDLRCVTFPSPMNLYDDFLLQIDGKFGKREMDVFQFLFRRDLPRPVLESREPLKWFQTLEQRGKLSWNDVNSLVDFFKNALFNDLVSEGCDYQARVGVIQFFQKYLQANLPEFCLDDKFNEKRHANQQLPKDYLDRCEELFRRQNGDESRNQVRRLFSKGVVLLTNSCSGPSSDSVQSACLKLLYLADRFYQRFKKMIVDDKELLNIEPLPSGKFLARDNRRQMPVSQRLRSSEPAEVQQQLFHRSGSPEVIQYQVILMCVQLLLVILTSLLGGLKVASI